MDITRIEYLLQELKALDAKYAVLIEQLENAKNELLTETQK